MYKYFINKIKENLRDKRFSEIITGSLWVLSARFITTGLALFFNVFVARWYGAEIVGVVAVITSFIALAAIFTVLGTDTSILRLIPEHFAKYSAASAFKVYRKTKLLVLSISIITSILFFFGSNAIAVYVFKKPHLAYYFALSSSFLIFQSIMKLNTETLRGMKLIRIFAIMQFLPQLFNIFFLLVGNLLCSKKDIPVYAVIAGFTLTGIIGWGIIEYSFYLQIRRQERVVENITIGNILRLSIPMLMTSTMGFIIGQTGIIMLGMFRTEAEVGYYSTALKFAALPAFTLNAVNSIVAPKFSELFHLKKIDDLFYIAKKSSKFLFYINLPIVLILVFFGKPALFYLFGKEFVIAYIPLILLSVGHFIHCITGATGIFMNMTGNQNSYKNIMAIAAFLNIGLNYLLIPHYGIYGASISAVAILISISIATLIFIWLRYGQVVGYLPFVGKVKSLFN